MSDKKNADHTDRSEFQLTLTCGFSRMDQAFDPEVFLDEHIRIEIF